MREVPPLLLAFLTLALNSGCRSVDVGGPVILYDGAPKPREEIAVIEVVKTRPTWGHPTINIREITRMEAGLVVVFRAEQGDAWSPLDHFGGLPDTQRQAQQGDVRSVPDHFEVLPGSYRIVFLYVPVTDKWGWTHRPSGESTTWLDCRAGYRYLLKGDLNETNDGWVLSKIEVTGGDEGG
ncbi:hypothetical protein ACFL3Z_01470 [Gemmatimonadota bacterium]